MSNDSKRSTEPVFFKVKTPGADTEPAATGFVYVGTPDPFMVSPDQLPPADVGKTDVDLTPLGRAWATVVGALASHGRARLWPSEVGRYIAHDEHGAAQLRAAGARPEVVAWAEAHHRRELWPGTGIPLPVCEALAAADG